MPILSVMHGHPLTRISIRCRHENTLCLGSSYTFNLTDMTVYIHKKLAACIFHLVTMVTAQQYYFILNRLATFLCQYTNLSIQSGQKPNDIFAFAKRMLPFETKQCSFKSGMDLCKCTNNYMEGSESATI